MRSSPTSDPGSTRPGGSFDVEAKQADVAELRERASSPDLWEDADAARALTRRLNRHEQVLDLVDGLASTLDDTEVLLEFGDDDSLREAMTALTAAGGELERLEMESLYFGEYDDMPAIITVYPGAGGVDAQDWAEMMVRMYERYLTGRGFSVTFDEWTEGEEAGIKSVTMSVDGDRVYGIMEGERGVHRLVRISPFDSNARRQTSFAAVDVVPDVGDAADVEINEDDLRIDTYRSQGAGGQHVNTTDSAVRITHLPTGVVVSCQNERSQLQNRMKAMAHLKSRLAELARQEREAHLQEIRGEQSEAAWGRQIRSYVLQPYQMVKDLRTGHESGNVPAILDGDIDDFVESYLRWRRAAHEVSAAAD